MTHLGYMIRSKQLFLNMTLDLEYFFIWMTEVWFNNKSKYEQKNKDIF